MNVKNLRGFVYVWSLSEACPPGATTSSSSARRSTGISSVVHRQARVRLSIRPSVRRRLRVQLRLIPFQGELDVFWTNRSTNRQPHGKGTVVQFNSLPPSFARSLPSWRRRMQKTRHFSRTSSVQSITRHSEMNRSQ